MPLIWQKQQLVFVVTLGKLNIQGTEVVLSLPTPGGHALPTAMVCKTEKVGKKKKVTLVHLLFWKKK